MEEEVLGRVISFVSSDKTTLLLKADPSKVRNDYSEILKSLSDKHLLSGIIINFNNPSIKEKEICEEKGIDLSKAFFIDGVAIHADSLPDDENIFFLFNAKDLDGVEIGIKNGLSKNKDAKLIIIDLLDLLLYYNSIEKIEEMLDYLKTESEKHGMKVFVFVNKDNDILVNRINERFDDNINI